MKRPYSAGQIAGICLLLALAFFGGSEVAERWLLAGADPRTLRAGHLARGVLFSLVLSSVAAALVLRSRRHYEQLLRERVDYLRRAFEAANDAIAVTDARGVITYFNRAAEEITGYRTEEVVGRDIASLYADERGAREVLALLTRTGGASEGPDSSGRGLPGVRVIEQDSASGRLLFETAIRRKDGRLLLFQTSKAAIRDDRGEVIGFIGLSRDLTQQRELEREVKAQQDLLTTIVNTSADAIIGLDAEDRILSWNAGAEHIFGYRAEEVRGRPFALLVPPERIRQGELTRLAQQLQEMGVIRDYVTERIAQGGRRVQVELTRTPLRDDAGRFIGSSTILRDITARKRLEARLVRAERLAAVGEMAATIAHEVKNPLAGIYGAVQVLEGTFPEGDDRRGVVREMAKEIARLDAIVRDLLDYARPTSPSYSVVDLHALIERVVGLLAREPGWERVRVQRRYAADLPLVPVDPQQMEQVIFNILLNSLQAMREGGDLIITTAIEGDHALLSFTDTGPGIPEALQRRIFDPFYTTKHQGTGLGLSVTRKIVEAHEGTIEVSGTGRGATFTVRLPVQRGTG